ncbi:DNA cytosine methyltransferase [Pseudomonas sp. CC6-YY-74]|uniref:DNA cytosine methyltransferase n=1 Tax=Pseudomonas sp. CC6-YY-74 TaxID=1930532 RepID=UPI0009A24831|nr:DNA cytosine methyltransferase [Pseudomonas sp. CC6-YY-74]
MKKKYRVVDLFCGCGGISRGLERTGRYSIEAGVEIEAHPIRTFVANHLNSEGSPPLSYLGDIREIAGPDAIKDISDWLRPAGLDTPGELDLLVGGPPCQGFSRNGVRQYEECGVKRFYDDPRNHLYRAFLSTIETLRPKVVLIENVREFLSFGGGRFAEDLLKRLDELGYTADYRKVCAADYGVPQIRNRVIFIGVHRSFMDIPVSKLPFPPLTHVKPSTSQLDLIANIPYNTVSDAIGDLPAPSYVQGTRLHYERKDENNFAKLMRSKSGEVRNHIARILSEKSLQRINAVGTGRMKHVDESLQTKSFYGSAYRRLDWNEPALTITTWVYHVGSGRFAHPVEDRAITMREAARLQSFDDDFIFPDLINPVSQMIGNAVPPLMAQAFGRAIADLLDKNSLEHRA